MSEPVPLITVPKNDAADAFQRMAERLRHNADQPFGGAFLIIPPAGGGDPLEALIIDPKQDAATYWTLVKTKADLAIGELDERRRQQQGAFGRR